MSAIKTTAMRESRVGVKLRGLCIVANLQDIKAKIFASPDLKGRAIQMLENNWYQYTLDSGKVRPAETGAWHDSETTSIAFAYRSLSCLRVKQTDRNP